LVPANPGILDRIYVLRLERNTITHKKIGENLWRGARLGVSYHSVHCHDAPIPGS
jgi:hypothetical protein